MTRWLLIAWLLPTVALTGPPCVPPELPAYATWHLQVAQPIALLDEDGRPVLVLSTVYADPRITALWVGDLLGLVDPNPDDPAAPAWIDPGVFRPGLAARRDPVLRPPPRQQTCRWQREPPDGSRL